MRIYVKLVRKKMLKYGLDEELALQVNIMEYL